MQYHKTIIKQISEKNNATVESSNMEPIKEGPIKEGFDGLSWTGRPKRDQILLGLGLAFQLCARFTLLGIIWWVAMSFNVYGTAPDITDYTWIPLLFVPYIVHAIVIVFLFRYTKYIPDFDKLSINSQVMHIALNTLVVLPVKRKNSMPNINIFPLVLFVAFQIIPAIAFSIMIYPAVPAGRMVIGTAIVPFLLLLSGAVFCAVYPWVKK